MQQLWYWGEYSTFIVADEASNYRLTIDGYSGDTSLGDILYGTDGEQFSTKDADNDDDPGGNLAVQGKFGFWHSSSFYCGLMASGADFYCIPMVEPHFKLINSQLSLQCN